MSAEERVALSDSVIYPSDIVYLIEHMTDEQKDVVVKALGLHHAPRAKAREFVVHPTNPNMDRWE